MTGAGKDRVSRIMLTVIVVYLHLPHRIVTVQSVSARFWKSLKDRKSSNYATQNDPICTLMATYPEVPDWW
ncbi:hypothetical protein V1522DRAFT_416556 [Lipomyces starkeyi]